MFHEMVEQLRTAASQVEGSDLTVYDNLTSSYQTLEETSAAKIEELTQANIALQAEISKLKSMNYDLMMAAGAPGVENDAEEVDDEEENGGIDSLFENDDDSDDE